MENILLKPIGIIHSPFTRQDGTPIQPAAGAGAAGQVEVFPEYEAGLKDLDGFDRIILLYHFHNSCREELVVTPYLDSTQRGVFASRAPCRPNRIGISCVKLVRVEKNVLHVEDVDILDGTPLIDIKPYVPRFDSFAHVKAGWLDSTDVSGKRADSRFE
jgi:tRNA-Thr(GGU) m(6)t(6)A37 methyltransferase TsaA